MKRQLLTTLALAGATTLFASSASADILKFASLPTGTVTQHPVGEGPKQVAATEKVPGFFVAKPPAEQMQNGRMPYVMIFAKEKDAKEFTAGKGGFGGSSDEQNDVCFSERAVDVDIDEPGGPAEWSPSLEPGVHLSPHFAPMPPRVKGAKPVRMSDMPRKFDVTAVHQEKFVDLGAGKAQLEMVDAWVDPTTRGVRTIGKGTLALTKVGDAPGGLAIYAARERTHVQIVVRRVREGNKDGPPQSIAEMRMAQMRRMPLVIEASSGAHDASSCGFARVTLHAEQGVGEMAKLETHVVSMSPAEEQPEKKESPLQALLGGGDAQQDLTQPEFHMRPMTINVSTTWTSRDKEPVVSLTLGWAGRDKKM
jgi:hypothetical protein